MAVHPLAKTLARSQRLSIDVLMGSRGGATMGTGCPPGGEGAQRADKDHK
jgi:hypothetical protein